MAFPAPRFATPNGVRLAVFEATPKQRSKDVCIVLVHGFPELGYSWRHQLQPLADAGYHVMAPDMRGYGQSDRAAAVEDHNMKEACADVAGLVTEAGYRKVIIVGHDFGGSVAWMFPFYQPELCAGVIVLNTPFAYIPEDPLALYEALYGPENYVAHFQTQACQDKLDRDPARSFRFFFRRDTGAGTCLSRTRQHDADSMAYIRWLDDDEASWPGEVCLSEAELVHYADSYAKAGFGGGLNWYRSLRRNFALQAEIFDDDSAIRVTVPALMLCARQDYICDVSLTDNLDTICDDVERHVIEDCGHWTQQEQPEATNRLILDWLARKF